MEIVNSSATSIFVLYLIISSNFLDSLFGCRIQRQLNENMILKHLLGLMTMFFFVTLVNKSKTSLPLKLLVAFVGYLFFMMTTKMTPQIWILFVILLGLAYVLSIVKDSIMDGKIQEYIEYAQLVLVISAIIVLFIGFVHYLGEKKIEYGEDFEFSKFFFGQPVCKGETPPHNKSFGEVMLIGITPRKYT